MRMGQSLLVQERKVFRVHIYVYQCGSPQQFLAGILYLITSLTTISEPVDFRWEWHRGQMYLCYQQVQSDQIILVFHEVLKENIAAKVSDNTKLWTILVCIRWVITFPCHDVHICLWSYIMFNCLYKVYKYLLVYVHNLTFFLWKISPTYYA